jgi:cAMP-binding proteins - catabolite gene activator and regulatory subunit of cAMP-dependent protein kinases
MKNLKLPSDLRERVLAFHNVKWLKFKGLDENQILDDLPKSLKEKITEFMLRDMINKSDLFPQNDDGFIMSFIRKFSFILIPVDEYVFRKGEIAEEIYFIVEGEAAVYDDDEKNILITLKKSAIFGEMGVIDLKTGTRSVYSKILSLFF